MSADPLSSINERLNETPSIATSRKQMREEGGQNDSFRQHCLEILRLLGHTTHSLSSLPVLHIAGSKGKGSTSSFVSQLLQKNMADGSKIGLYSSPHVDSVCERIRINGSPMEPNLFAEHFNYVWNFIGDQKPPFIVLTAALIIHISISENIDVLVLETSLGGAYDAATVFPRPVATGITLLDFEHVEELGKTIEEIAWHKGGIFKAGVPSFTVYQPIKGAHEALVERCNEIGANSLVVADFDDGFKNIKLGSHQYSNAALAVLMVATCINDAALKKHSAFRSAAAPLRADLTRRGNTVTVAGELLTNKSQVALRNASWPCVCKVATPQLPFPTTFYIDNAHTPASVKATAEWFAENRQSPQDNSVVFWPADGRNVQQLFDALCIGVERYRTSFSSVFAMNVEVNSFKATRDNIVSCDSAGSLEELLNVARPAQVLFVGSMEASLTAMKFLDTSERAKVVSV